MVMSLREMSFSFILNISYKSCQSQNTHRLSHTNLTKTCGEPPCSWRVNSFCSTSGNLRFYSCYKTLPTHQYFTYPSMLYLPIKALPTHQYFTYPSILYLPIKALPTHQYFTYPSMLYLPINTLPTHQCFTYPTKLYLPINASKQFAIACFKSDSWHKSGPWAYNIYSSKCRFYKK